MNYAAEGFFVGIFVMAVVTCVLRVAPLLLWERLRLGETVRHTLARVPPIVLTAVIVATLAPYVRPGAATPPQYGRFAAFLAAVLAQYWLRNTLLSILVGLAVAAGLPYVTAAWQAGR